MTADRHIPAPLLIGQFSRVTCLSVRMLRYYDEHGILTPAVVDPETGYRLYAASQLRDAHRVRTLRDLGFGVAAIAGLLSADTETLTRALAAHRTDLESTARDAAARLAALDGLLSSLKEHPMSLDVSRTTHPAQTVVALRRTIPSYAAEGALWDDLMAALPPGVFALLVGPGLAIFHDAEYREADVDVEIALPLSRPIDVTPPLTCGERPAQDVVVATMVGPYDQIGEVTAASAAWIAAHGLTMTGGMYNRYLVGPAQSPDPQTWVTQVCINVA